MAVSSGSINPQMAFVRFVQGTSVFHWQFNWGTLLLFCEVQVVFMRFVTNICESIIILSEIISLCRTQQ
jgi:hypothetical protein